MSEEHENPSGGIEEVKKAADLAQTNIQRFLKLQSERETALVMKAHQEKIRESATVAADAAERAASNIRRFLKLQSEREGNLVMKAHRG